MNVLPPPIEVFISYAQQDMLFLAQLETHLSILQRQGLIAIWHDQQILAGTERVSAIDEHLQSADLILLLISPDYLASVDRYEQELQHALERHEAQQTRVIAVLVRPTLWEHHPLSKVQALPRNARPISTWSNRDKAWVEVAQSIQTTIMELGHSSGYFIPTKMPSIWTVPYTRNPFFTGRDDILTQLATKLNAGQTTALTQSQAVAGLGGIGKTQLAVEYAYRYQGRYQAVLWAGADSHEALVTAYEQFATWLELPERTERDQNQIVTAVRHWLREHKNWLLILDNVEDLKLLSAFLPPLHQGHVLLTTRMQVTYPVALEHELDCLSDEEGALLLLRRTRRLAHDASLDTAVNEERQQALTISQTLGGLPLALDQAGAYILETACTPVDYLQLYGQRHAVLLARRSSVPSDHPESVTTTFSLTFEQVSRKNPAAAELLRLSAFLAPDAIPEEIVSEGSIYLGPSLQPIATNPLLLNDAIEVLRTHSLIRRNPSNKTLSIHRLVQIVLKDGMNEKAHKLWAERAIRATNQALPDVTYEVWSRYQRLLPHALICASLITQYRLLFPETSRLLSEVASYLYEHAQYSKAELLFKQALEINEEISGPEHPTTAVTMNNLALLYRFQGRYSEAEPLMQQALMITVRSLGPNHAGTARILDSLATLYQSRGQYSEAESLFKQAITIYEHALGSEHLDTAQSLNNLALLYYVQRRYSEAEPLMRQALAIREQALGPDHPITAISLNYIAELYRVLGRYSEAEPLMRQALAIREQALGPDHPTTAISLDNLAGLYQIQGQYSEAEPLLLRALMINENVLGLESPKTARSLNNLAELYYDQGRYQEAEPLYQRALTIWEQTLGPTHPTIVMVLCCLARLYLAKGMLSKTELFLKRALNIQEQSLEVTSLTAIVIYLNLIVKDYYNQGQYSEAEQLLKRILNIQEQSPGTAHLKTAQNLNNLAMFYYEQRRFAEAKPLFRQALAIREQQLGSQHPDTVTTLKYYASLLQEIDRQNETITLDVHLSQREDLEATND